MLIHLPIHFLDNLLTICNPFVLFYSDHISKKLIKLMISTDLLKTNPYFLVYPCLFLYLRLIL